MKLKKASILIVMSVAGGLLVRSASPDDEALRRLSAVLERRMGQLDVRWEQEAEEAIPSLRLESAFRQAAQTPSYGTAYYHFRCDGDTTLTASQLTERLTRYVERLEAALDEVSEAYRSSRMQGRWIQMEPLVRQLELTVFDQPLDPLRLNYARSTLSFFGKEAFERTALQTEALLAVARRLSASAVPIQQKRQGYAYLLTLTLRLPWLWPYVEPVMVHLARQGGAPSDTLLFKRTLPSRLSYSARDAAIWKGALRVRADRLVCLDPEQTEMRHGVSAVSRNAQETKVTLRYEVTDDEWWIRFDGSLTLLDVASEERYRLKRLEGGLPIDRTLVLLGCKGRIVAFTLVFPAVKPALEAFRLDNSRVDPSVLPGGAADLLSTEVLMWSDYE
jgi:hypothetical protein